MPNQENKEKVQKIEEDLEKTKAFFLADYSGLNVNAQQELREKVREAGGSLKVTKNTLLKIALKNQGYDISKLEENLQGPNIALFAIDNPIAPLKVITEFAKKHKKPEIKTGILEKEVLSLTKIEQLASLPSKQELLTKLVRGIQSPVYGLVNTLQGNNRKLIYALNTIKDKMDKSE